jgi:hypothetical protein
MLQWIPFACILESNYPFVPPIGTLLKYGSSANRVGDF